MHLFIPWWALSLVPVVVGTAVASLLKSQGDYDFLTPVVSVGAFLIGLTATLCLFLGHWL